MCEKVSMFKRCPTCKQRRGPIIHQICCDQTTYLKLGRCSKGLQPREEVEELECRACEIKRKEEAEEEYNRRFAAAWDEPVKYEDHSAMSQSPGMKYPESGDEVEEKAELDEKNEWDEKSK
ncbi:hypothetical protein NW762_011309 [Fusarium torreyae]|uniref:Stc1 domain-containing protein n=1 Tax=Fusarium torreyae TaxID=1237075 RepID=A0A9W8RSZ8_9HYPO|nr:hypothetical protein NW762_011309 [Fusarium torreyae]